MGERDAEIRADCAATFTALRDLVENAVKWCREKDAIGIEILRNGSTVRDEGPGLDDASSHLLFERFWRADSSASGGAGLGLRIAAEIARAHGGEVKSANRKDGSGAVFTPILAGSSH